MKNNKLKIKLISFCLIAIFCIYFNFDILAFNRRSVTATNANQYNFSDNITLSNSISQVSRNVFGNKEIEKSEYLYNFDDAKDYVYVEYGNGGYAVFFAPTMELMEYSLQGRLDYNNSSSKKYYGGPGTYVLKNGDSFKDTLSSQEYHLSNVNRRSCADSIRDNLMSNYNLRANNSAKEDFSLTHLAFNSLATSLDGVHVGNGDSPSYDGSHLIPVPEDEGTYIPNYQYFLARPKHGCNTTGTCAAISVQLLLSYHNYYSDRRIIDNIHLNGDDTNPEDNPNLCADPTTVNSNLLGTRGVNEDGSDDENSYFAYVISKIPSNSTNYQLKNGIISILSDRNQVLDGSIDYSLSLIEGGWLFGLQPVSESGIKSEINAGRPTIISLRESLGATDHAIVAYGYYDYTPTGSTNSYSGFITHFGWGSDSVNVWVNSAWCYAYYPFIINHNHTYSLVGSIGNNYCKKEYRCTTCGHRKGLIEHSDFNYTFIDGHTHEVSCSHCDYTQEEDHEKTYHNINETYHKVLCSVCGYQSNQSHSFINHGTMWRICTICGGQYRISGNVPEPFGDDSIM